MKEMKLSEMLLVKHSRAVYKQELFLAAIPQQEEL